MKNLMVLMAGLMVAGTSVFASGPVTDVCTKQIVAYVEGNLGTRVRGIQYDWNTSAEGHTSGGRAWVTVESCSGYYIFNLPMADAHTCANAHYGTIPNYIGGVWASGACRR